MQHRIDVALLVDLAPAASSFRRVDHVLGAGLYATLSTMPADLDCQQMPSDGRVQAESSDCADASTQLKHFQWVTSSMKSFSALAFTCILDMLPAVSCLFYSDSQDTNRDVCTSYDGKNLVAISRFP